MSGDSREIICRLVVSSSMNPNLPNNQASADLEKESRPHLKLRMDTPINDDGNVLDHVKKCDKCKSQLMELLKDKPVFGTIMNKSKTVTN